MTGVCAGCLRRQSLYATGFEGFGYVEQSAIDPKAPDQRLDYRPDHFIADVDPRHSRDANHDYGRKNGG